MSLTDLIESKKSIKVELVTKNSRYLSFKLSCSKGMEKYFNSDSFYVRYDRDIQDVNESILYIPIISNIITVAWVTGADIHVKELDETYLGSLNKIKTEMKKMYPAFPFSSSIYVDKIVSNSFSNKGSLLLFSGGLDSMTSYIGHRAEKPNLVRIWGADIPLSWKEFWVRIKNETLRFADGEGVEVNFIEANMRSFLNEEQLISEYGWHLTDGSWWAGIQHGLGLVGLCAPLTAVEDIKTIYISSTYTPDFKHPWGSDPSIDNNISWAGVNVFHDGYELSRQEAIRCVLKNYIENTGHHPLLIVCLYLNKTDNFNCNKCEKCCRTIAGLVLEGIDPNKCGFNIDGETFGYIKQNIMNGKFISGEDGAFMWRDVQSHIPKEIKDFYGSKEFFEWFRYFNISAKRSLPSLIFYTLPTNMQKLLFRLKFLRAYSPLRKQFIRHD